MTDLSKYTSFHVGGPAQKILQVSTQEEIIAAIEEAGDSPILILGGGTNVLVSDSGFEGTVIRISNNSVQTEVDACSGATLTIGAGEDSLHACVHMIVKRKRFAPLQIANVNSLIAVLTLNLTLVATLFWKFNSKYDVVR